MCIEGAPNLRFHGTRAETSQGRGNETFQASPIKSGLTQGVQQGCCTRMPTPLYTLRLPQKTQDDIAEMGKVYGAPNGRAFAREILEIMCSGDPTRVQSFNRRLMMAVGEQLALKLNEPLQHVDTPVNRDAKPAKPKKKKRRKRAERS